MGHSAPCLTVIALGQAIMHRIIGPDTAKRHARSINKLNAADLLYLTGAGGFDKLLDRYPPKLEAVLWECQMLMRIKEITVAKV